MGKCGSAKARFVRGSPLKIRRVLNTIRGRPYEEAIKILDFTPFRSSNKVLKCLNSAVSNATTESSILKKTLFVSEAFCDIGPVYNDTDFDHKDKVLKLGNLQAI